MPVIHVIRNVGSKEEVTFCGSKSPHVTEHSYEGTCKYCRKALFSIGRQSRIVGGMDMNILAANLKLDSIRKKERTARLNKRGGR